jgi:hypothetical protein
MKKKIIVALNLAALCIPIQAMIAPKPKVNFVAHYNAAARNISNMPSHLRAYNKVLADAPHLKKIFGDTNIVTTQRPLFIHLVVQACKIRERETFPTQWEYDPSRGYFRKTRSQPANSAL